MSNRNRADSVPVGGARRIVRNPLRESKRQCLTACAAWRFRPSAACKPLHPWGGSGKPFAACTSAGDVSTLHL